MNSSIKNFQEYLNTKGFKVVVTGEFNKETLSAARSHYTGGSTTYEGQIKIVKGYANKQDVAKYLRSALQNSSLLGKVLPDSSKYGVSNGSIDEWILFFIRLCDAESGFKINPPFINDPGGSFGLFQVSCLDGSRYRANPTGKNWTMDEVLNPINNTNTAIKIFERQLFKHGKIITSGGKGAGGYYAAASMRKIAKAC